MIPIIIPVFILITLIYIIYIFLYDEKQFVKSSYDNKIYIIHRKNKSPEFLQESANMLAKINERIELLISHLNRSYSNNPKYFFIKFLDRYNNGSTHSILSEASIDNRYTTYTLNKEEIHICLRTRNSNDSLYDINLLMYVLLHELAHLINYSKNNIPIIGHGDEFLNIFEFLVKEAIKIGIYKYENYNIFPKEYCNMTLDSSIV
jgi:hypothetical protein